MNCFCDKMLFTKLKHLNNNIPIVYREMNPNKKTTETFCLKSMT